MDPEAAARTLLDTLAHGGDITPLLAPDVHVRSDRIDVLDRDAAVRWLQERLAGTFRRFVPGQVVMKRNLVFAWWSIDGLDGVEEQGTWILSMDRDGVVTEWQEFTG